MEREDPDDLGPAASAEGDRLNEEAHLLDLGSLQEMAAWLLQAASAGVVGAAAYDLLRAVKKRFGDDKLQELRAKVHEEIQAAQRRKHHLPARDLRARVDKMFEEFER